MKDPAVRRPDFLIIGAMKAATTSLYRWLQATGLAAMPEVKEPNFFTHEWNRGRDWYLSMFNGIPGTLPAGEASVSYSDPALSEAAAFRIHEMLPTARFVFVARNPIDRLRSHYRHEVQRNRERRPFSVAVTNLDSTYVQRSMYGRGLQPYFQLFAPEQFLIVEFDDLIGGGGFGRVLEHLGVPVVERPIDAHNVSAEKRRFTALARWLYERGWTAPLGRMPGSLRRLGRLLGTRQDARYGMTMRDSQSAPVPNHVVDALRADVSFFEASSGIRFNWKLDGQLGSSQPSVRPLSEEFPPSVSDQYPDDLSPR